MKVALEPEIEKRIRRAVKLGDPWALDELTEEMCGNDSKLRREFSEIVSANRTRDALVTRTLRSQGWRVLRIWEHELAKKNEARRLRRLTPFING
jgi:G:T-mismatch repair DNA endonuclease (very short patch repair protein)